MKTANTGHYSLIQYCPDRSRLEAANVGVLLFVPAQSFLQVRLAQGNDRIRRFFQDEVGDLGQLNVMKRLLEHRIEDEVGGIRTPEDLQRLLTSFANELIFTALRPVRVENPEIEIAQMFEDLVGGGRVRRDPPNDAPIVETLRQRLETPELSGKVLRRPKAVIPILGEELLADYGFQNGRLNLIQTKEFNQVRPADVLSAAVKMAVDGHLLFKHPDQVAGERQLVVVGSFGPAAREQQTKIERMLADHDVTLYLPETIDALVARIRETAH